MKYQIYLLTCGRARYVGSSVNFKRRFNQHIKELREGTHSNDFLLAEFKKGNKLKYKILQSSETLFREEILRDEQRWINRKSNCNEGVASKIVKYTRREFMQDVMDFIVTYWRWLAIVLVIVLVVGLNMSFSNASEFIFSLVDLFKRLGQ